MAQFTTFYIIHEGRDGEYHQLTGSWDAVTPEDAIAMMLRESGAEDDGKWEAHEVTCQRDVIT